MTGFCKLLVLIVTGVLASIFFQLPILIPIAFPIWVGLVIPLARHQCTFGATPLGCQAAQGECEPPAVRIPELEHPGLKWLIVNFTCPTQFLKYEPEQKSAARRGCYRKTSRRLYMSENIKSEAISRRKTFSLLGLAAAFSFAVPAAVLSLSDDAEAQTTTTTTTGTRGQQRRAASHRAASGAAHRSHGAPGDTTRHRPRSTVILEMASSRRPS